MNKLYFLLLATVIPAFAFCQNSNADSLKLNEVIIAFQESIQDKDSTKFNQLFFKSHVPFVGIMSEATEWSIKKDYSDFEGIAVSDHIEFIQAICETQNVQKEVFYNTEISHDNSIASISFDYAYYDGERMVQWGHEKWNLVKVDDEWLITDVIYSIHFPKVEPFPFK